jgi:hypothetical protein
VSDDKQDSRPGIFQSLTRFMAYLIGTGSVFILIWGNAYLSWKESLCLEAMKVVMFMGLSYIVGKSASYFVPGFPPDEKPQGPPLPEGREPDVHLGGE